MNTTRPTRRPAPHAPTTARRPRGRTRLGLTLAARLLAAAALLTPLGCSTGPDESRAQPEYPANLPRARTLDVQVFKTDTELRLTNTSTRSFGPGRLWLNQWHSRPIDGLAIGQTLKLPLREFRDPYGEPFRAGGFFATQKPDTIALTELESEGRLFGLIIVNLDDPLDAPR